MYLREMGSEDVNFIKLVLDRGIIGSFFGEGYELSCCVLIGSFFKI
jgi:hypothetical protein